MTHELKMSRSDLQEIAGGLRYLANREDECSGSRRRWGQLAAEIEEQVKPAIEEPTAFGSVVRAGFPGQPKATANPLWQRSPSYGEHYWASEYKDVEVWPELTDVEVLRVGLGGEAVSESVADFMEGAGFSRTPAQDDAYSRGYEDGAQSNRPSPVDRSVIIAALRDAIATIRVREGHLVDVSDSYELADAVMGKLAG